MNDGTSSRKRKIIYVESNVDGTVGGSYFSLLFLIEALNKSIYEPVVVFYRDNHLIPCYRKAGARVYLFCRCKPIKLGCALAGSERRSGLRLVSAVFRLCSQVFQKTFNYLFTFLYPSLKCWFILRRERADLVHLNNTLCRPHEWMLAALFSGTRVVAHERGINQQFSKQAVFWARRLSAIVCISDAVKLNLIRAGFPKDKLVRIYNGLEAEKFSASKRRNVVLRELGIGDGSQIIGVVGNIKQWKGQEVVIRALKRIRDTFPNVKCLIVGHVASADQWYLEFLKALIRDGALEDAVIFTGPRKDVADLVNCMRVLIHSSVEPEPFGRVLLEGMALKRPVISTRIGAPLEIVVDGRTGILVAPGDPEELAEAVVTLLSDRALAERMGAAGYERLVSEFTVKRNVELTESLYAGLLGSKDQKTPVSGCGKV